MGEHLKVEIADIVGTLKQRYNVVEAAVELIPYLQIEDKETIYEQALLLQQIIDNNDGLGQHSYKFMRLLEEVLFYEAHREKFLTLTKRENEVLVQMALGKSNKEIASFLFITVNTVETHRKNIKRKLEVVTFYEINKYARAFNLI